MKLLIITQKVDINDDILGFMHRWVVEFAKHCEKITVITLSVGRYDLPANVKVLSLGKEAGASKLKYLARFYSYIWRERKNYDAVFVHMNQEYAVLGGLFWRLAGKKVTLWRNHQVGGFWVRIAVFFSDMVFCTSKFAFIARYKKNKIMPVGIDTDLFKLNLEINKTQRSVLFLSRISPIKKLDLLISALALLKKENVDFTAKIIGDAPARDKAYFEENKLEAKSRGLESSVEFKKGVPNRQAPEIYNQNEIFVNLTNSGSLDKTTLEAMACEGLVLVSNRVFEDMLTQEQKAFMMFREGDARNLADRIKKLFELDGEVKKKIVGQARDMVIERHSLKVLADKLFKVLSE